ncbi:OmpA family protein [Erythrobacter sp. WG]|uniref:OmpA family protein n=1 Tax=Erythrobacter sp. WG TaxID=2985510 RepID=UPI00226FB5C9|nr:OmpA family protein [Erythrobacter sp. WG]MCX9148721.1 OmpA family protein [Erythrobacter sp. WG]
MRNICLLLGGVAVVAIAGPASARDGRPYLGINGGIVFEDQVRVENEPYRGSLNEARINTGTGWEGDVVLGYDFGRFRLEAEAGYKNQDHDTLFITGPNTGGLPVGTRLGPDSTQKTYSAMVNGLIDFGRDDGLQVYAGGGAGIARVDFELGVPGRADFIDDSGTAFAWQGIAGLRYPVTDNIDVGLKYRYFRVENLNINGFNNAPLEARLESHSALASVIVNFGGRRQPEPVAAPPAPPPVAPPPPPPVQAPPPPPQAACNTGPYIVFFDFDRSDITPEAAGILNSAASAYANCGNARVMLAGHTDRAGSVQYNQGLAQRRNSAVQNYLASRGVPGGAISAQAFGESQPRVPTADGVREPQNRRVEVTYGPGSGM